MAWVRPARMLLGRAASRGGVAVEILGLLLFWVCGLGAHGIYMVGRELVALSLCRRGERRGASLRGWLVAICDDAHDERAPGRMFETRTRYTHDLFTLFPRSARRTAHCSLHAALLSVKRDIPPGDPTHEALGSDGPSFLPSLPALSLSTPRSPA